MWAAVSCLGVQGSRGRLPALQSRLLAGQIWVQKPEGLPVSLVAFPQRETVIGGGLPAAGTPTWMGRPSDEAPGFGFG